MSKIVPNYSFQQGMLHIHIFSCKQPDAPVIYLHDMDGYGRQILPLLKDYPPFHLVTITIPDKLWSHILAPWNTPVGFPDYVACTGGAPEYLKTFVEEIIPHAESLLPPVSWRGIAGYSLGGLFSIYAMCKTELFDRVASASGSLWYPGFEDWFTHHVPLKLPKSVYFSSSRNEYYTTNPFLAPNQKTTEYIQGWLDRHHVQTTFVLNPGNHYQDVLPRTAAAVGWILENPRN